MVGLPVGVVPWNHPLQIPSKDHAELVFNLLPKLGTDNGINMGVVHGGVILGTLQLSNPTQPELTALDVSALADSGAVHLCIPEHLAIQPKLSELERREVVLADGHRRTVPYVGPAEVRFANRRCFTGALVRRRPPLTSRGVG